MHARIVGQEVNIELSEPKKITFIIAVVAMLLALGVIPSLTTYAFWLALIGFIVLALGNLIKDL